MSVTSPTSMENNNQFCTVITSKNNVATEDREKRDRSTEKQIVVAEDEKTLIIAADSLENLRSNGGESVEAVDDLKHVDEVIVDQDLAAEDDEGLGDINHGSEASRYLFIF